MAAPKDKPAPTLGDEDVLAMLERGDVPVTYVQEARLSETFSLENLRGFAAGQVTWAQLTGLSKEEAYALAERAHMLFSEGRQLDGCTVIEGLVLANPQDGYFHGLLASFYQRMGKRDEALEEYAIALELNPGDIQAHVNRGELLLQSGRFEEALSHLRQAVERDATGADPAALRARALARATAAVMEQALAAGGPAGAPRR